MKMGIPRHGRLTVYANWEAWRVGWVGMLLPKAGTSWLLVEVFFSLYIVQSHIIPGPSNPRIYLGKSLCLLALVYQVL